MGELFRSDGCRLYARWVGTWRGGLGVGEAAASFTRYRLAYALDRDSLDSLVGVAMPASLS